MPSDKLKAAYQRHYAKLVAIGAVTGRRLIVNRLRMMEQEIWPAVYWSKEQRGLAFVREDVESRGQLVRFVGAVETESYGSSRWYQPRSRGERGPRWGGWFTDPDGCYSDRDGDGLCWGVVVQLVTRNHVPRFAAGYQFGGCDGGPTIDFSRIFEDERDRHGNQDGATDCYGAREAARYADDLAKAAAEEEREYREEQREQEDDEDLEAA